MTNDVIHGCHPTCVSSKSSGIWGDWALQEVGVDGSAVVVEVTLKCEAAVVEVCGLKGKGLAVS